MRMITSCTVRIGRQLYLSKLIIRRTCGNNKELVSASENANQLKYKKGWATKNSEKKDCMAAIGKNCTILAHKQGFSANFRRKKPLLVSLNIVRNGSVCNQLTYTVL